MAKMTLFPVGNGDSILLEFDDGRLMLVDYCHKSVGEDEGHPCIDLSSSLSALLADLGRDDVDVVVFTHRHADHTSGAEDFFTFDHAAKYQGDGRIAIGELWVPAALVLASDLEESARVIRQEARYRITQGAGIRVFSAPDALDELAADLGVSEEDLSTLIVGAGEFAPGWTGDKGGAGVFVHSPFSSNCEPDAEDEDTNGTSIVLHLTLFPDASPVRVLLGADAEWEVWQQIVRLTEYHGNDERLMWDVFKLAHHCSYTALSEEAGDGKTVPAEDVDRLFEQGQQGAILVASSNPIDGEGTPPHVEAAEFYRSIAEAAGGTFLVTMEYQDEESPEPLVIELGEYGPAVKRSESARWSGAGAAIGTRSSRYGSR